MKNFESLHRHKLHHAIGDCRPGRVEGVATGPIRDRRIMFRMGDSAKKSHMRIQAAIRGPALPCEFELLD